jgi:vacuolar protein sorting-associated protein 45
MVSSCAENFPPSIFNPVPGASTAGSTMASSLAAAPAPSGAPGLNLRAGGYELSVGGTAGTGLYRASPGEGASASFQIPKEAQQVAEGIRDGAGRLWGNVRQRMEERASRSTTPQGGR